MFRAQLELLQPTLRQNTLETEAVMVEVDKETREVESIRTVMARVRKPVGTERGSDPTKLRCSDLPVVIGVTTLLALCVTGGGDC
jgi:hypothetical protein